MISVSRAGGGASPTLLLPRQVPIHRGLELRLAQAQGLVFVCFAEERKFIGVS
jgi:hypothetical protein